MFNNECSMFNDTRPPCSVTFLWFGGIAYLNDPDSNAGWSFYSPGRASQVRQVEG